MISKQVYCFPYNARQKDGNIIYLSDKLCVKTEKFGVLTVEKGSRIFYGIKNKILICFDKDNSFYILTEIS